jgi:hypothetical protein
LKDYSEKNNIYVEPIIVEKTEDEDYIMPINKKKKKERRLGFGE